MSTDYKAPIIPLKATSSKYYAEKREKADSEPRYCLYCGQRIARRYNDKLQRWEADYDFLRRRHLQSKHQ